MYVTKIYEFFNTLLDENNDMIFTFGNVSINFSTNKHYLFYKRIFRYEIFMIISNFRILACSLIRSKEKSKFASMHAMNSLDNEDLYFLEWITSSLADDQWLGRVKKQFANGA